MLNDAVHAIKYKFGSDPKVTREEACGVGAYWELYFYFLSFSLIPRTYCHPRILNFLFADDYVYDVYAMDEGFSDREGEDEEFYPT